MISSVLLTFIVRPHSKSDLERNLEALSYQRSYSQQRTFCFLRKRFLGLADGGTSWRVQNEFLHTL